MKNASKLIYFCVIIAPGHASSCRSFSISDNLSYCLYKYMCTCQGCGPDAWFRKYGHCNYSSSQGREMSVRLIILLSSRWMIYFLPNENREISRAIYLILFPRRLFFFKRNLPQSEKVYFQERFSNNTDFLCLSWP